MSATDFTVASGATRYLEVEVRNGTIGFQLAWLDAVSSATVTLELTAYRRIAAVNPGSAWEWKDSGLSFTGPAASAAGALIVNIENVRLPRARIKIVAAAACIFDLREGGAA